MSERRFSGGYDLVQNSQFAAFIWLILAAVIGIVLYLTYYFTGKTKQTEKKPKIGGGQAAEPNRPIAGGRRPRRMRVREFEDDNNDGFDLSDEEEQENWTEDKIEGKIGVKKQKKLEMKAEKRAERQAEIEEREERKKREAALALERKKEEERQQKEELQKAELEAQRKEEQERREHEEYLKLKEAFTVEEEGEIGILTEEESQSLLQEFVDYIQRKKVILLEDLAAHFSLKTQDTIDRLENLQEMGRLTGVMDDRGKFIYISEEELINVAKFIKQRGRVSIAELAESSNTLITLQEDTKVVKGPKAVDVTA